MLQRPTLTVFLVLLGGFALLAASALVRSGDFDSPFGLIVALPYIAIYLLHGLGIPGLLQHQGACGWGWCAPTTFGWVFLVLVWAVAAGIGHRCGDAIAQEPVAGGGRSAPADEDQRGRTSLRGGAFGIVSSKPQAVPQSAGSGKAGTGAVRRSTRQRRIHRCHVLLSAMETVCDAGRSLQS